MIAEILSEIAVIIQRLSEILSEMILWCFSKALFQHCVVYSSF